MITLKINMQPKQEARLKYLISKQGNVENLMNEFLQYKTSELEKAIVNIKKDLRKFELKYKMKSVEFFAQFNSGKYGDEDDYMIWSGIYELWLKNISELEKLK